MTDENRAAGRGEEGSGGLGADIRKVLGCVAQNGEDPCRFDHHGYCQAHGWMSTEECYVATAIRVLALLGEAPPKASEAEPYPQTDVRQIIASAVDLGHLHVAPSSGYANAILIDLAAEGYAITPLRELGATPGATVQPQARPMWITEDAKTGQLLQTSWQKPSDWITDNPTMRVTQYVPAKAEGISE
jgi:hypothetical protein